MRLDVVNDEQVAWLQVEVHDAFRVDLVQAQEQVLGYDLDLAQVESLAPRDEVLDQVGWPGRQFKLLALLYLGEHAAVLLRLPLLLSQVEFNIVEEVVAVSLLFDLVLI